MKTKTIITSLLLLLSVAGFAQQKGLPGWDETSEYIDKIMNATIDYNEIFAETEAANISIKILQHPKPEFGGDGLSYSEKFISGATQFDMTTAYSDIDWSKMIKFDDENKPTMSKSPIKFLTVVFPQNSLKFTGYISLDDEHLQGPFTDYSRTGKTKSHFRITIPYRNIEGEEKRLRNAITHLSNLAKEEKAREKASDPFRN